MVFLADFDGDPAEYLAVFGLTIPRGLRWSFGMCEDFPGGRPTRRLIDYVNHGRVPAVLEYAAYPEATVRDIDAALTVANRIDGLRDATNDRAFAAAYDRFLDALAPRPPLLSKLATMWRCLRHRPTLGDLTVVVPLDDGNVHAPLPLPPASVFATVPHTHFARVVHFAYGGRLYALFSAAFDGPQDQYLETLVSKLGASADEIWMRCEGYPGHVDAAALCDWLAAHRLAPSMLLASNATTPVERIIEVLARREQALDLVATHQHLPLAELRHELAALWRTPADQLS